ncbi:MAG: hypothetical protein HY021_16785 [Burkholderiales bacterium]|nr:hypothetical protein [Burkholderiales bacterium]
MTESSSPLRAVLDRAIELHTAQPEVAARMLHACAPTLSADAEGEEAIRHAEHVLLGHRADANGLRALLASLPAALADGAAARRARFALAVIDQDVGAPADADQHRALQNAVLTLALRGRCDEAAARLDAAAATALADADSGVRQAHAACTNNVALHLRIGPRGDAARDALMLHAARLARAAWAQAGTWVHVERAEYQLALCHAVLGRAEPALAHAQACWDLCLANDADAAERFFALEAQALAQRAARDEPAAADTMAAMDALRVELSDASMREWCAQTLNTLRGAGMRPPPTRA